MENQLKSTQFKLIRNKDWYESLKELKPKAIKSLSDRLNISVYKLSGICFLTREDIQEFINDIILVTIQKIKSGQFEFQNYSPLSYSMEVARKLLSNRLRIKRMETVPLDTLEHSTSPNVDQYYLDKETQIKLGLLLKKMGANCEHLIRLKYYDELKDEEIIRKRMTDYQTVDSLKVKRSQCLGKLKTIVKTNGITISKLLN